MHAVVSLSLCFAVSEGTATASFLLPNLPIAGVRAKHHPNCSFHGPEKTITLISAGRVEGSHCETGDGDGAGEAEPVCRGSPRLH